MPKAIDWSGRRFGRWTVLRRGRLVGSSYYWLCECACGTTREVHRQSLASGKSLSCRCLTRDLGANNRTHGLSHSPEYKVWQAMHRRCESTKDRTFERYGGRGISVCQRWQSFANFIADMGRRPSPVHTIDRIDNDGPYAPHNCRWTTIDVQNRNRRSNRMYTLNGETKCMTDWCRANGLAHCTVIERLRAGWSVERALTQPVKRRSQQSP